MHTKDKLAEALLEADLGEMAAKAREGYYHDFLSPLDMPIMQLVRDLTVVGTPAARALSQRAKQGDFDATQDEADAWADSPESQEVFGRLFKNGPPKS
jgi:hypothetical protein